VVVLQNLGIAARRTGDVTWARAIHESALELLQGLGSPGAWTAAVMVELAADQRELGQIAASVSTAIASVELAWSAGDRRGTAMALDGLSAALVDHEPALAVRLCGLTATLRDALGSPLPPGNKPSVTRMLEQARKVLGESQIRTAQAVGSRLATESAIAEAKRIAASLSDETAPVKTAGPAAIGVAFALSSRERDVLRLLVEGRTNPEIARTLAISHKTVRNHVTSILSKLGVESRTAAATFAIRHGLA
jgi:DNA-binding CsgD family transcriptional regulator